MKVRFTSRNVHKQATNPSFPWQQVSFEHEINAQIYEMCTLCQLNFQIIQPLYFYSFITNKYIRQVVGTRRASHISAKIKYGRK